MGTPYILETLSLVLSLMRENPRSVIYIAGPHEHAQSWQSYGLQTELTVRLADPAFDRSVIRFFDTLPRSLLLVDPSGHAIIRIGSLPSETDSVNEVGCSSLVKKVIPGSTKVCLLRNEPGELAVAANIAGENRLVSYAHHPGLVLLPSESRALAWSLFSAPNRVHRDYFNFFYDAYALLKIGSSFAQSVLELFNQDVREQTGFKKAAIYSVLTGNALQSSLPPRQSAFLVSDEALRDCEKVSPGQLS